MRTAGATAGSVAETGDHQREDAYQVLFVRHFRPTVRLAQLLGADDAEDVAQEAFVRLHQHGNRLRDPAAALAYVRRTTVNLVNSRLRHLRVVRRTPGDVPRTHASAEDAVVAAAASTNSSSPSGPSPLASGRPSSCATGSTCPSRRWPTPSTSPSAPPSP